MEAFPIRDGSRVILGDMNKIEIPGLHFGLLFLLIESAEIDIKLHIWPDKPILHLWESRRSGLVH